MKVFLGVDIGSVISKAVLLDGKGRPVAKKWTKTLGNPRRAVESLVQECLGSFRDFFLKDFEGLPIPTLVYSGSASASESAKLEAFVYQVKRRSQNRRKGGAS